MTNQISELLSKIKLLGDELNSIEEILLFGSQRIKQSTKSDIDILIILKNDTEKQKLLESLCNLSLNHKILIHPIILDKDEFSLRKNFEMYKKNILAKSHLLYGKDLIGSK
jgi:predicted nucleotidyltransferase